MKILIAEDEALASERLQLLLKQYDSSIEIVASLDSVEDIIEFMDKNPSPDLLLLDIHLSDGHIFELFNHIKPHVPIIFTTAYDEYALKAFKYNSIDYLLKPIRFEELSSSLKKYKTIQQYHQQALPNIDVIVDALKKNVKASNYQYKSRFLVKYGDKMQYQDVEDIAYFYMDEKACFLSNTQGKRFIIEYSLEQLESILDPALFFRINRKFILKINAIKEFKNYINSRLKILLEPHINTDVIVSREKVTLFKQWIDQ